MANPSKLRRAAELFERGQIVVVGDGEQALTFWVMKPNTFEKDEALKDGRYGRALRAQAFDRDPREAEAVTAVIRGMSDDELLDSLLSAKSMEFMNLAYDEVRADPKWEERLEIVDRQRLAEDRPTSEKETETIAQIASEHAAAAQEVFERLVREERDDLAGLTRTELEKRFRDNWREMVAVNAFYEQRRQTEIFYALRDCDAERVDGEWRHNRCDHEPRLLEDRADVLTRIPDEVMEKVVEALEAQMSPAEAGNSDAPTVSSGQ